MGGVGVRFAGCGVLGGVWVGGRLVFWVGLFWGVGFWGLFLVFGCVFSFSGMCRRPLTTRTTRPFF